MATYTRREVTTRTVEYLVPAPWPAGACWVEVYKAVNAAHQELAEAGRIGRGDEAPDSMIRIKAVDDEISVSFDLEQDAVMEASQ